MSKNEYRVNTEIEFDTVRLIAEDGEQVGVVPISVALSRAENADLDLVEIAPQSKPPVCKIMDFSKFMYEQKKKKKEAEKKSRAAKVETKELRLRPTTDDHDIDIKLKKARQFLVAGNRVQFTVKLRGRELAHLDNGKEVLNRVLNKLGPNIKVEQDVHQSGNNFVLTVAPG